jgi:hypothetical protein
MTGASQPNEHEFSLFEGHFEPQIKEKLTTQYVELENDLNVVNRSK